MEYLLSLLSGGVSGAVLVWLTKSWISERLKQSIGHEYSARLEQHKYEYSQELEKHRADLSAQLEQARHYNQVSQLRTSLFFDHQRSAFAAIIKQAVKVNDKWAEGYNPEEGLYDAVPRAEYQELVSLFYEHQLFLDDECLVLMTVLMEAYTDSYPYYDGEKTHYKDNSQILEFVGYVVPRMASIFRGKIGVGGNAAHLQEVVVLAAMILVNGINLRVLGLDFPPKGGLCAQSKHGAADMVKNGTENISALLLKLCELDSYLSKGEVMFVDIQLKVRRCLGVLRNLLNSGDAS
ncbi:hypothetical protein [Pseudomonas sp. zjy_11]|uniref:hypothetical protein n=1 Tax=unclassified Pseudomonas TaxID=196821 RepID=UPI00370BE3D1